MEREQIEVWVTKYALSTGVFQAPARVCVDTPDMIEVNTGSVMAFYCGKDWHRTETGARLRVVDMIAAKRKSLTKEMNKLDAIEATVKGGALPMMKP